MTLSKLSNSQETSPLLTFDDHVGIASRTENAGGSAADDAALRRNEIEGEHIFTNLSLHVLSKYLAQEKVERHMTTSSKTNDI